MLVVSSVSEMQSLTNRLPAPVALVPTMGALHPGHLALVHRAKREARKAGATVTSIFVNPTQFGPNEDFQRYPRSFEKDCELLREIGCDIVFAPEVSEMYFADSTTTLVETKLSTVLCGASRPGHFSGVCTVVNKLFHIVQPDIAVFGQKDYQQFLILQRMVRDLNFSIQMISEPTVREPDGLALSSRNAYLTAAERAQAPIIFQTLLEAEKLVRKHQIGLAEIEHWMASSISTANLSKVDYVAAVDPSTLETKRSLPLLLACAVYFGSTRLIDNRLVT